MLTLILGGARSGKSSLALRLATERGGDDVLYVATAEPLDEEMATRIERHRAERPAAWDTLEAPVQLAEAIEARLRDRGRSFRAVVVDCVTVWMSNVVLAQEATGPEAQLQAALDEVSSLLDLVRRRELTWLLVSNEVGMGLVPPYPLGRVYRDVMGRVNQELARAADEVILVVAGLPWHLKRLTPGDAGSTAEL